VVECALKAVILVGGGRPWGHVLGALSVQATQLAALPNGPTARYAPRLTANHSLYETTTRWRETLRYRSAGTVSAPTAAEWVDEAQAVYESTVVAMRLDGVA